MSKTPTFVLDTVFFMHKTFLTQKIRQQHVFMQLLLFKSKFINVFLFSFIGAYVEEVNDKLHVPCRFLISFLQHGYV